MWPATVTRVNSRDLDRDVAGCAASHQRLLASLDGLTDEQAGRHSLLPNWTVGHVLSHLARNADGFVRMLEGAERGEVRSQYEHGAAGRTADIDAGSGRGADELVIDVRMSIWRLEQTWASLTETGWHGRGRTFSGELATTAIPSRRWRETEIHSVDLGLGYRFADLPADFVRIELNQMTALLASRKPMGLTDPAPAALALTPNDRLAWLFGRLDVDGLAPAGIYG